MHEATPYLLIAVLVLLLVVLGLLVYSIFFQKDKEKSLWKWVATFLTGAGSAFSGLYAATPQPSEVVLYLLGGMFSVAVLAAVLLEIFAFIGAQRSGAVMFQRAEILRVEYLRNGRPIEDVARELRISLDQAAVLLQILTLARGP